MLNEWLVRTFVSRPDEIADPQVRKAYGFLEGVASIVVNLAVFAVKLVPGLLIGSVSLIADAFHSLGDVASSVVIVVGFRLASKPSDREHPFGHGRVESVTSFVVSLLLLLTAWEFGKASLDRLLHPRIMAVSWGLLALLAGTMVLKEWLSRFSRALGTKISSSALIGDFWHHRSDVIATGLVILALLASKAGWLWVDGLGGILVSGIIAWAGVGILKESVDPLIGEAPSPHLLEQMRSVALAVPGVEGVHDLIVHRYGSLTVASLHVEVSASLDIERGHEIAEDVESGLNTLLGGWSVVHIDPVNRAHPLYAEVQAFLAEMLPRVAGVRGFHDLRIVGSESRPFVIFDLQANAPDEEAALREVKERMAERFPTVSKVGINVEPSYVF
ncbi:MAG: cation diffusion facilitator family transporter [Acidobacteriota bacterium]